MNYNEVVDRLIAKHEPRIAAHCSECGMKIDPDSLDTCPFGHLGECTNCRERCRRDAWEARLEEL